MTRRVPYPYNTGAHLMVVLGLRTQGIGDDAHVIASACVTTFAVWDAIKNDSPPEQYRQDIQQITVVKAKERKSNGKSYLPLMAVLKEVAEQALVAQAPDTSLHLVIDWMDSLACRARNQFWNHPRNENPFRRVIYYSTARNRFGK